MPSNLYKLNLTLIDTEEGRLLIENFVNIFFVTPLSVSLHNLLDLTKKSNENSLPLYCKRHIYTLINIVPEDLQQQ